MRLNKHLVSYSMIASIVVAFFGLIWGLYLRNIAYTNDAYVHGNQIYITPLQDGTIVRIHTDDTFLVKEGQVIAELDDTYAKIALEKAKVHLATTVREVCQIYHRTFALLSDIEVGIAELIVSKQDWDHRVDVINNGGVSLENLQHAEAALKSAYYQLKATESSFLREKALIQAASIRSNPMVQKALDDLQDAAVALYRTKIYAPNTGLIAQRTAQVGMFMKAGDPLMSVIPLDQIWVNANYKETQMKRMKIGQKVKITADMYGFSVVYDGTIVGLPGGAGNAFSLLPPQNLSGNWIKIVQRLPVRVALDPVKLSQYPLRIGQTMRATTNLRDNPNFTRVPDNYNGPLYTTNILLKEDFGSEQMGDLIITANIDPLLKNYDAEPFQVDYKPFAYTLDQLFNPEVIVEKTYP